MATVLVLMRKGAQLKMGSINLMQCQGGFGCVGNHLFLERGKMVLPEARALSFYTLAS